MNISNIVESITKTMEGVQLPANILPATLLKCVSLTRTGLSAYKTTSKIIEGNRLLNIPTGENPDGTQNLINAFVYNVVKNIFDALKNDASIQSALGSGKLLVQTNGANAGGALVATGSNLLDVIINGIVQ